MPRPAGPDLGLGSSWFAEDIVMPVHGYAHQQAAAFTVMATILSLTMNDLPPNIDRLPHHSGSRCPRASPERLKGSGCRGTQRLRCTMSSPYRPGSTSDTPHVHT
ncbi:MAG: hypothetical protein L0H59_05530 [Tomitella sp.]|nr:hypothetical protein [Tomitella sp.]